MSNTEQPSPPILLDLLIQRFEWIEKEFNSRLSVEEGVRLSRAQILFMSYLEDGRDRSSDMVHKLGITRQAVSLLVKELKSKGIIKLEPDPAKASAKLLRKTDYGTDFVNKALEIMATLEREIAESIGANRFSELRKILIADWDNPGKTERNQTP